MKIAKNENPRRFFRSTRHKIKMLLHLLFTGTAGEMVNQALKIYDLNNY
jgi:hypothetical protein